jgi:hypothetical protein
VLKLVDKIIVNTKYPHDKLQLKLCRIYAQVKMRMYKTAMDELETIGDFDGKENCFESYSDLYPNMRGISTIPKRTNGEGSMVPFTLRVIKAELPFFLKNASGTPGLDQLYELLDLCRKEISILKSNEKKLKHALKPKPELVENLTPIPYLSSFNRSYGSLTVTVEDIFAGEYEGNEFITVALLMWLLDLLSLWQDRENRLIFAIATHLVQEKEYPLAIILLQETLQKNPNDVTLLSSLARVFLQVTFLRTFQPNVS